MRSKFLNRALFLTILLISLSSCTRLYYSSMKKLGKEKRDILVNRILDGKKAQQQAADQFKTALEAFVEVTKFDGGELEKSYKKLNKELEHAEDRAKKVTDQIESIDHVARDLFKEWEKEIDQMSTGRLKTESKKLISDSRDRHEQLMRQMRSSEMKMQPVLSAFRDQVLFLKHNLNSKAIGSLKKSAIEIDNEVGALIKEMERSNQKADQTIAGLNAE
jgi:Protein of unknown function (DUF2959)